MEESLQAIILDKLTSDISGSYVLQGAAYPWAEGSVETSDPEWEDPALEVA